MEQEKAFHFDDDELDTLEQALALYAAYVREMRVDELDGDEHNADEIRADYHRAKSMHMNLFELTHEHSYVKERLISSERAGRPVDVNDFSPFDFYEYKNDDYNEYRVDYFEDGERIEKTIKGDELRTIGCDGLGNASYVIDRDGSVVWSHSAVSTNTVELVE